MALGPEDLVLCSGTLRRESTFRDRLAAARAGGFRGISLWGRDYRLARESGLSDSDLRAMLDDNGLAVAELDLAWWWLPGAAEVHIPPELDDQDLFCFDESSLFAIAEALGARSLNAIDVFGGRFSVEAATETFASLCDRAADHGLLVHIEFLPWSKIPDLAAAWTIVRDAERPNGGIAVDSWHFFASDQNLVVLKEIPGDKVHSIQLSDAPSGPRKDPLLGSLHDRLLPGDGELDLAALLAGLRRIDASAPIGVEVFSDTLHALDPVEAGRLAGESVRALLADLPT